uniref:U4/U6.U5 tri-snRNP-associated protein 1 n=1 Tax=Hyaloperonospora arabidopsidis (strain Emoy2) TaxID=559515 RepID=M4BXG0_HYAAE
MAPRRSRSRSPVRRRHGSPSSTSTRRTRPSYASPSHRPRLCSRSRDAPVASPPDESKNGESSLSIEATNKLRASLGLKPLKVRPCVKKEQTDVRGQQETTKRQQEELQRTLEQSKTRRELLQKVAGKSLGEQLREDLEAEEKPDGMGVKNVLEWVKQSRKATAAEEKKEEKEKKKEKTAYAASALAGMTVGHSLDTFEDGEDVVLTLKDSSVLQHDGKDLNHEDEDELVNVELSERDRRVARQARARRAVLPVYSGYDDDEFDVAIGKGQKLKTRENKLLAQYDEEQDAVDAEAANKFRLDASGGSLALLAQKQGEEEEGDVAVISLAMDRTKRVEDYFTKEEVAIKFSNHKKGKKLRKKKKQSRRHCNDDLGENDVEEVQLNTRAGDAGGDSASLIAQLEQEVLQTGVSVSKDRGKRKRNHRDGDVVKEEANLHRFQEARDKANAVAMDALAANTSRKSVKRRQVDDSEILDDTAMVEKELDASLARARQLTKQLNQSQVSVAPPNSEARIAQLVRQSMRNDSDVATEDATDGTGDVTTSEVAQSGNKSVGHVFGTTGTASNTVVFNEATDFETRLRDAMEKRAAQFQAAPEKKAAPVTEKHDSATEERKAHAEVDEVMEVQEHSEDEETKENDTWGEEQPLVGTGMGATLALLRKTGDLRQTRVERQAGRANDARDRSFEADLRIKNGVKLDYRDEFGRLLTKKEAFRKLSYKFHGQEPGKKKKEKRLKQLKEELKAQKQLSGEGSTKMMKVLERKQKHTKEAHVVLSSGI